MNLLRERAEDYTSDELDEIGSIDAHLVRSLEGHLFSSSGEGRPCTVIGGKGTGKTFNLIKTLRRGTRELEDFLPVMFVFEKSGEIEPLDTSLLKPGSGGLSPELEGVSDQEATMMADAIVFDDFHYVCEAIERGEYPPSKLIEFLRDVLNRAKAGKRMVISSADQLSAYSDVIDDPEFDRILLEYGFGEDADMDALARLEVSSSSLRAWKDIAKGLGIEADDVILRFIHRCNANPRKLVRFASLFEGKITRPKLRRKAKKRMEKLAEEGKVPFGSEFLVTLFRLASLSKRFGKQLKKKGENLPLNRMLERLEKRRENIQAIAEELSEELVLPELEEVEEEKWGQDPVYTVSKKYQEGPLGKKVIREKLDKSNWTEGIKSEFLDFIKDTERYEKFLKDLRKVREEADEHFAYILENFDALFERMGSEWFPLSPCRAAFHDILYDSPVTEESLEFSSSSHWKSLPPLEILDRVAPQFDLPRNVQDDAHQILEQACSEEIDRGESMGVMVVGSLYTACRKNSSSRSIKEFEEKISAIEELEEEVSIGEIFSVYRQITTELDIETIIPGPSARAVRISRNLELTPEAVEKAIEIVEKAREKNLVSGKSPRGVAAGAVYLSLTILGEWRTQREVGDVANVTEVTVRNRYQELKKELDVATERS